MKLVERLVTIFCGAELIENNSDNDSSSSTDVSETFVPTVPSIPTGCASVSLDRKVSAQSSVAYKPTKTVATTAFNLPPPAYKAPSPPSPYCATSTAARAQQQVNNLIPNAKGDFDSDAAQTFLSLTATLASSKESLQATLNNFTIGFTPERLQQLNDKILDRTLTPSELSSMPKIISKFSEFIVSNKGKKSNANVKTSQILNTYTNLLLMYNSSTTKELHILNNTDLRSPIENVYTHLENRLKALEKDPFTNTTQYNTEEHLLIGAQFCFLRLLLDYNSSNYSDQMWDVKSPIDKDFREVPALLTKQLRNKCEETKKYLPPHLDCILVMRILAVGLLSDLKTDGRHDIPLLKEIYTTLMAADQKGTFPARIKAVQMITELAIRSNDKSAKQKISELLKNFAQITENNKKLIEKNKTLTEKSKNPHELIAPYKDPFSQKEVDYDAICKFINECAKKIENS